MSITFYNKQLSLNFKQKPRFWYFLNLWFPFFIFYSTLPINLNRKKLSFLNESTYDKKDDVKVIELFSQMGLQNKHLLEITISVNFLLSPVHFPKCFMKTYYCTNIYISILKVFRLFNEYSCPFLSKYKRSTSVNFVSKH